MWLFQKSLFQLIERLTVLQRRKRELARESVKLQTKVANSLRSAVEKNFLTMIFFGKNKTFDVLFQEGQNWCYRCISSPVWDEQRGGEKGIWKNYRFCRHNIHTICNRTRTITITHLIISCKKKHVCTLYFWGRLGKIQEERNEEELNLKEHSQQVDPGVCLHPHNCWKQFCFISSIFIETGHF